MEHTVWKGQKVAQNVKEEHINPWKVKIVAMNVPMEHIQHQLEVHHVHHVQTLVKEFVLKLLENVHHVKLVMVILTEHVLNVTLVIIPLLEQHLLVKNVQLEHFLKIKVHQVVQIVPQEHILHQVDQNVPIVLQEGIRQKVLEVALLVLMEHTQHLLEVYHVNHVPKDVMVVV